ncbi:elongation of very long chain fatty acids protein AAEL008004 [Tetranychus urticae]|uniref:Elongation of very long chain fatty acids protein n=1 Tax=Tetranychus urticae TaxID=32264 RepID=T1K4N1_TETUR|nr:elongation of very long chain fatty acids protein AAEL008004 [Tetranychus urticae]XP_015782890.1 elongation of very long chain fatty acids protein AAEL008004 [Tetranychus urticae]
MFHWLTKELDHFLSKGDPRVAHLPLMQSPFPVAAICLAYVLFVKKIGPNLMKNRKPFEVRMAMIIYNFTMVLCSSYVVYTEIVYHWLQPGVSLTCDPVDYSVNPISMKIVYNCYFYFLLKFVEFTDTIFFVVRKKNEQISNLHVIHHGLLPFSVWWGAKFVPGGHATFFGFVNSIVHVIMYTYYGLAAIGPVMKPYLWWKKYLTIFQLVQFVAIGIHSFQLFFQPSCSFPKIFGLWIGSHGILFWFLFTDFYDKTYKRFASLSSSSSSAKSLSSSSTTCSPSITNLSDSNGNIKKVK